MMPPTTHENYPSTDDYEAEIRATFAADVKEGMVGGPLTLQQAAQLCDCDPQDIVCGALAGKLEGDKVRTIHDGTVVQVNPAIQANTPQKTLVPHV